MVSLDMPKVSKLRREFDTDDLYDRLNTLGDYLHQLSAGVGKRARRQFGQARYFASETAHDTEEAMKDHLAVSLILALGLGILVGYFIRRGNE